MKNNKNLFRQRIQEYSTKEQMPFAGLQQDLRQSYKAKSATGNDIMEMLHDIVSGAEADNLDGLTTRLTRLDKMGEFFMNSDLDGKEQEVVFKAHRKVQAAIKKRKDEYTKKHELLKGMLSDVGSGALSFLDGMADEIPQLKVMVMAGSFLYKNFKKAQDAKKQKLAERQNLLKRDAELYYSAELRRENNDPKNKNKLKQGKKEPIFKNFDNISSAMLNDNLAEMYGQQFQRQGQKGIKGQKSQEAIILTGIANDVKIIANYFKGQLIRDKDRRMDDLEALREGSRLQLQRKDGLKNLNTKTAENNSGWMSSIVESIFGITGASVILKGLKNIPKMIKGIPGVLKAIPGMIKSVPGAILSTVGKIDDFLRPETLAKTPGKALDWVKSLPGKGMKGISTWWNGAEEVAKNAPLGNKILGEVGESGAKTLAKQGSKAGIKATIGKIPIVGAILGGAFAAGRAWDGDYAGAGMELASGAASTIPGYGTAGSFAIDAALAARDMGAFEKTSLNPFGITEANASVLSPEEINKKKLLKDAIETQTRQDPSTTPSAIVPIAKLAKTGDLKDLLDGDSSGLGFIFSLKNIDRRHLLRALVGSLRGRTGGTDSGSGSSGGGSRGNSGSTMSGAMGNPTTGSSVSGAAAMVGSMRQGNVPSGPRPGPMPAPGQTETEQFMQAIGMAETGKDGRPMDDPSRFIRTKGGADSSAYGPYQITKTLAEGALKNTDWVKDDPELAKWMQERFIPHGKKMLNSSYSDTTYGAGGQGDLNTEYDRKMYMKMSKALMGGTLRDAGGNPLEAAADWRFGESSNARDLAARDPRYYNEVSKSMEQQKNDLAKQSQQAKSSAPEIKAQPTKNLLGEPSKPTLGDEKQFAREKALEEWNASNDPNKGTPEQFLKQKGLLPGTEPVQSGSGKSQSYREYLKEKAELSKGPSADPELDKLFSDENPGGKEGVDYVVDPDNGEKLYFDKEYKEALKLENNPVPMTPARETVAKKSEANASKQAETPAPAQPIVYPVPTPAPASGGESRSGSDTLTERYGSSFGKSNDL